jgi:hypothetical protein
VALRLVLFDVHRIVGPEWAGVHAGVRTKRGVEAVVPVVGEEIQFEVNLRVRPQPPGGVPNFLGPAARGTPTERHISIGWGFPNDAGGFRVVRGCKVFLTSVERARWSLPGISWEQIRSGRVLEARWSAVGSDGGPVVAGQPVPWVVSDPGTA